MSLYMVNASVGHPRTGFSLPFGLGVRAHRREAARSGGPAGRGHSRVCAVPPARRERLALPAALRHRRWPPGAAAKSWALCTARARAASAPGGSPGQRPGRQTAQAAGVGTGHRSLLHRPPLTYGDAVLHRTSPFYILLWIRACMLHSQA